MNNLVKGITVLALGLIGLSARSNAQTVVLNGLGSSAIFLELGKAAEAASPAGLGATCLFTTKTNVVATDTSTGSSLTDTGNAWIAWTPGTAGNNTTCGTTSSSTHVYAYLQTDSVVGNRCLFNAGLSTPKCTIANTIGATQATANLIYPTGTTIGSTEIANLPTGVASALNVTAATAPNFAGTDIRPEDAEFAETRARATCGSPVVTGSQYLGLGYSNGASVQTAVSGSTSVFHVIDFTLPSGYVVTPVGATPIVVVVNGSSTGVGGFSDTAITNITSPELANFLDGTYSRTRDLSNLSGDTTTDAAVTVWIREPLSGTYNTMEYNVPNTVALKTSQDVGLNQQAAQQNCSSTLPAGSTSNPMNIVTKSGGARERAIGTGQELAQVLATNQSLGYGFWSVANFSAYNGTGSAANAKYLQVDGVDPIQATYSAGAFPALSSVTLQNVANGGYPIWSNLRLVSLSSMTAVTNLASAAQNFVAPGTNPDFIPASSLTVFRSHFIPPAGSGEPTVAANGTGTGGRGSCSATEVGGDVGGAVYTKVGDVDFCSDFSVTSGQTGVRR